MPQFDLHEIAFPTLTDKQVEQLGGCTGAEISKHSAGDVLIQVGDRNFRFFVIRSGEIEILDQSGDEPTTIAIHGPGEFTGDVSHLTGTPAIFTAIALSDCELYAIAGDLLKQVINRCPDLGDIILRAFMARAADGARVGDCSSGSASSAHAILRIRFAFATSSPRTSCSSRGPISRPTPTSSNC